MSLVLRKKGEDEFVVLDGETAICEFKKDEVHKAYHKLKVGEEIGWEPGALPPPNKEDDATDGAKVTPSTAEGSDQKQTVFKIVDNVDKLVNFGEEHESHEVGICLEYANEGKIIVRMSRPRGDNNDPWYVANFAVRPDGIKVGRYAGVKDSRFSQEENHTVSIENAY